ncbi:hypothetical protein HMPREF0971_01875 [Segatella oris F0302]|uniref:Uncharacterized protein n=1 Tax=Segatella oris F0302 TaxID=649760 RepID=D1QSB7_9BACT|nr:hypothetical protein HMPREF0971_01875 [Segatella oris F0302]
MLPSLGGVGGGFHFLRYRNQVRVPTLFNTPLANVKQPFRTHDRGKKT